MLCRTIIKRVIGLPGEKIEIKDAMLFLQRAEVELDIHKKVVLDYVKLLYQEENHLPRGGNGLVR